MTQRRGEGAAPRVAVPASRYTLANPLMRLVDLNLSRDELADRLGGASIGDASLRLPANYDLPLGESVLVRVRAPSMGHPVFLEGVVQWRRPQATRGQAPGTGVRLVAAAVPRW